MPCFEGVTLIIYNSALVAKKKEPAKWVSWLTLGAKYGEALIQLVSGTLLIFAIFMIRGYLTRNRTGQLNVRMLLLHSITFGLYMISIVLYQVFFTILVLKWPSPTAKKNMCIGNVLQVVLSFVVQVLLCFILDNFGNKELNEVRV